MKKAGVVLTILLVGATGIIYGKKTQIKKLLQMNEKYDKFRGYYYMLSHWLALEQDGKSLSEFFEKKGFHTIAIYGMGDMGERLAKELQSSNIKVQYAIERNKRKNKFDFNIINIEDADNTVDAIVVSATFAYSKIRKDLEKYLTCPIISLEDVVFDI